MEITNTPNTQEATKLTQEQILEGVAPEVSREEFEFGGRTFKVMHLNYPNYMTFLARLKPLLGTIAGGFARKVNVTVPGIDLGAAEPSVGGLMDFCSDSLPEMVAIVCNMQAIREKTPDKKVTTEWVIDNAASPWQLANIVMMQVEKNNIIGEFAAFFAQVLPTLVTLQRANQNEQPSGEPKS